MFVEFESTYRLLDLPEEADAESVRQAFQERLATIEEQKANAGSKPERMIAAKALADLEARREDAEKLAAALDARALVAEAKAALEEEKGAKASRAVKNARAAAEKSGLRTLLEAVADAEDSLADSGLVRDPAFDAELEELVGKLAQLEAAAGATGSSLPTDFIATLGALEGKRAALLARLGPRKDDETRGLLEGMAPRLQELRQTHEARQKEAAVQQALAKLEKPRQKLAAAAPLDRLERIDVATLRPALQELERLLAAPVPPEVADNAQYTAILEALKKHAEAIRGVLPRREALAALDAIEADLKANRLSSSLAARLGEVEKMCQEAGVESAPARLSALREAIARQAMPPPLKKAAPPPAQPPRIPAPPPAEPKTPPAPAQPPPAPQKEPRPGADDTSSDVTVPFVPRAVAPEPAAANCFTLVGPKGERCHVVCANPAVFGRSRSSDVGVRAFHASNQREADRVTRSVSRAHFMVAVAGEKIELIDGAPQPDGSHQRSVNGTFTDDGTEIEKLVVEKEARIRITRETDPAIPPAWQVRLQKRATLGTAVGELRDANPPGPDCAWFRRIDGSKENVLLLWRAANLRELGLATADCALIRHQGGFLLWEGGRLLALETGFRVGGQWQVAKLGELSYGD